MTMWRRFESTVPLLAKRETFPIERRRLLDGIGNDEKVVGMSMARFVVQCDGNAVQVLQRAKELMLLVNAQCMAPHWPTMAEWLALLPDWFLASCGPERTEEEVASDEERWQALSYEEQREERWTARWSPADWLYCMQPEERVWIWLDGQVADPDTLHVAVDLVEDWLGVPDDFDWLFRSCGATLTDSASLELLEEKLGPLPET